MTRTPLYRAYSAATRVLFPAAFWVERRKVLDAGLSEGRAREKAGHATAARPDGQLIWFHAASVGESLSVLSVISRLGEALPRAQFLITSGTPTSAALLAKRMPPRCRHQFAPLDAPGPVQRFLAHWQPDAAVFVESELWPQMLTLSHAAGIPLALIGARMSEKSLSGWKTRPRTARMLLKPFRLIRTQTASLAEELVALGADPAATARGGNLKSLSAPLPVDAGLVATTRDQLGARPVWVAASTHPGEEAEVLDAHARLLDEFPDLCLILAPRHPDRRDEIADLITGRGWPLAKRSAEDTVAGPVYLADTLGELGSWFAMTPFVFLGGSLRPIGGHNPYEVAQTGAAVLSGTHVSNTAETFSALEDAGGARFVSDSADLADKAGLWLRDARALVQAQTAARGFADTRMGQLDDVARELIDALGLAENG